MIIYIGFSSVTHKFVANIVCKRLKHCAPVVIHKNTCEIYQFTKYGHITIVPIKPRDIKILQQYGWKFVEYNIKRPRISKTHAMTCVQFTKQFCGINKIHIQTPDALFQYINQHKNI